MNKFKIATAATLASGLALATPAIASSPGQLQGGNNTYVVKNVTKGGAYSNSVSAVSCGDTIKYSIQLSNTGFGALHNINVKASLGSTSNMTAVPSEGAEAGTSASVTTALGSNQSLSYDSGSTTLYDGNGNVVKTLSDGITAGGVNVGDLAGSTNEFVNFTAKVNCPETPKTPETPGKGGPTSLPETGPEAGLAGLAGTSAIGYAVAAYRRSKRALAQSLRNQK